MVSESTFCMSISMDPPYQSESALVSALVSPMDRTTAPTMSRTTVMISAIRIWCHLLVDHTLEMGVSPVVLWH